MKAKINFLKFSVIMIGIVLTGLGAVLAWLMSWRLSIHVGFIAVPFSVVGLLVAICLILGVLVSAWQLLKLIQSAQPFAQQAVKYLNRITKMATILVGLFIVMMPLFYLIAVFDDAPGMIIINLFIIAMSAMVGVFGAILAQLFKQAMLMKSELDLTI